MDFADFIVVIAVSYYWTGVGMVSFHRTLDPIDQPAYASWPLWRAIPAIVGWPFVAAANRELPWFGVTFVSSLVVYSIAYWILGFAVPSTFWRIVLLGLVSMIPFVSAIIAAPLSLISAILWRLFASRAGWRVPSGIGDRQRQL